MSEERTRAAYNSGNTLRILVVEDHSDTLEALSRLLNHFGHEISTADDARSALDMINSKEFDVVLCDIALPDGNGYDVVAEAKRKRPLKAVALSGFAGRDDIERGRKAGFDFSSCQAGGFSRAAQRSRPDRRVNLCFNCLANSHALTLSN